MAAKVPLSDAELADRRKRVNVEFDRTVWRRALSYFLECPMCQSFWTALAIFLLTTPPAAWWPAVLPTALAYTTASALSLALPETLVSRLDQGSPDGGTKTMLAGIA